MSRLSAGVGCWLVVVAAGPAAAQPAGPQPFLALDPGGHTAPVVRVAFTPDGRRLLTGSVDKTVRVWDVATGRPGAVVRPPVGPGRDGLVNALAVSPTGTLAAVAGYGPTAGRRGRIYLIDYDAGQVVRVLDGHDALVVHVAFSADGTRLASCAEDAAVRVWDVAAGRLVHALPHPRPASRAAFTPDGRTLATGAYDGAVVLWDAATGRRTAECKRHTAGISCLGWSPDGTKLVTGGRDQLLTVWDAGGRLLRSRQVADALPSAVAFPADGRSFLYATGGIDAKAYQCRRVDLATDAETVAFARHDNTVHAVTLSPDGRTAASAGNDTPGVSLWRPADGTLMHRLEAASRPPSGLDWSADGDAVAWGTTRVFGTDFHLQPVERAFRLTALQVEPKPPAAAAVRFKAGPALNRVGLNREQRTDPPQQVTLYRGTGDNFRRSGVYVNPEENNPVRCYTLVGPAVGVVGGTLGLYQFDPLTGKRTRTFRGHSSEVVNVAPRPGGRYFASAGLDQTIRVWRTDADDPLVSLFAAGDDWVTWTPEGYYACSPGGERLMGWHLNRGDAELGVFHPAERFHKQLYRPDVIRRLLDAGGTPAALAAADAAAGTRPTKLTDVTQLAPPAVAIRTPAGPLTDVTKPRVTVTAAATPTAGYPIRALRLLVNGRPHDGPGGVRRFDAAGPVEATWDIDLPPGRHQLVALAETAGSDATSAPVAVRYAGGGGAAPARRLFVLAVGVSKYRNAGLNLDFAAADATALAAAFDRVSRPAPFDAVVAKVLTDDQATRAGIFRGLKDVAVQATAADSVLVYFSGHGKRDAQGQLYLLPADVDESDLTTTGVDSGQLKGQLARLKGRVVLVLDACHAGAASTAKAKEVGVDDDAKAKAVGVGDDLALELSRPDVAVIVMCSSRGSQTSREDRASGRGVYTHALIEGLTGKAPRTPADGPVFQHHLDAYVKDVVRQQTGGAQTPTSSIPGDLTDLPLAQPAK